MSYDPYKPYELGSEIHQPYDNAYRGDRDTAKRFAMQTEEIVAIAPKADGIVISMVQQNMLVEDEHLSEVHHYGMTG